LHAKKFGAMVRQMGDSMSVFLITSQVSLWVSAIE
jgi:hypothetical protein